MKKYNTKIQHGKYKPKKNNTKNTTRKIQHEKIQQKQYNTKNTTRKYTTRKNTT